jgi:hypothetical protein
MMGKDFPIIRPGVYQSWCRTCHSKAKTDWSKRHPERRRAHNLKRNYNLTSDEYEALFAQQHGACAICQKTEVQLTVDHCHKSGKVRALLCSGCNGFIGKLETYLDRLDLYLQYIQHHREG